ncbi:serine hydrolase FSH [Xylariomycetidae sp. FL0641]|nr:serine hydrolase FSH [Xylariomycetidae sp. FL0641]
MMKVLCLHAGNSSGRILESQIAPIVSRAKQSSADLTFDFLNGPFKVSEETSDQPALHDYCIDATIKSTRRAHEWLAEKIVTNGPYDGAIAFSHGASLLSSFILYRQWYEHELPTPFRFAIFISGSISLDVLKDLGVPVSASAETVVREAESQSRRNLEPLPSHAAKARRAVFNSDDCFGINLNKVPLELKIRIPTVHIWGEADPLLPTSIHLAGLCDPYIRKLHTHDGGHQIPEHEQDIQEVAQLLEWCTQRAVWPGHTQD